MLPKSNHTIEQVDWKVGWGAFNASITVMIHNSIELPRAMMAGRSQASYIRAVSFQLSTRRKQLPCAKIFILQRLSMVTMDFSTTFPCWASPRETRRGAMDINQRETHEPAGLTDVIRVKKSTTGLGGSSFWRLTTSEGMSNQNTISKSSILLIADEARRRVRFAVGAN